MGLTYYSYLKLDRLLDLQKPRTKPEEHDELLFIVIHQAYELWFKQMLYELDDVKRSLSNDKLFLAISTFKRVRMIMKNLVHMVDILETMTPLSFASFRDRLETASGFQSYQFRELEFVLGHKRPEYLKTFEDIPDAHAKVAARLNEPSLVDHFYDFLEQRGVEIPRALRDKPVTESTVPDKQVQAGILDLYRNKNEVGILFEYMTDFDEGLQEWRYRHVKLAERAIGNKRGTGGSSGVEFLKKALFRPIFPDLWAVRAEF